MTSRTSVHKSGFTLIETIIYIAILAFLITGGVISAFYIIEASEKNKTGIVINTEANFLLKKIDWVLAGALSINSPAAGLSGAAFSVNLDSPTNPTVIDLAGGKARISEGGSTQELTSDRVKIENLLFLHIAPAGLKPPAIRARFNIDGNQFEIIKYLRK